MDDVKVLEVGEHLVGRKLADEELALPRLDGQTVADVDPHSSADDIDRPD